MTTKKLISVAVIAASLSACATCRNHPVACTAAGVIIGASIALSVRHDHSSPNKPLCENNPSFPNGCHPIS